LVDRFHASGAAASQQVRVARALEEMPVAREALASGRISSSAVRVLVDAKEEQPEAFGESESLLVQAAQSLPIRKLSSTVSRWSEGVDAGAAQERARRLRERRKLSVFAVPSGMVRVEGDLDPENGEVAITALRAIEDAWVRQGKGADERTAAQRRADAFGEIARQWLDRADRPSVGSERPHLVVMVGEAVLSGRDGRAKLVHAGAIGAEAARQIACDSSVTRMVLRGASEPLDLGRRTPVVPPAIRRAVAVRDGGCTFAGCDRPPGWTDVHHVRHWADGGETSLSNLTLLCRPHHRLVHEGGFRIEMVEGRPMFRRPDGSVIEDGRGPP
jgi:hypothetical protein